MKYAVMKFLKYALFSGGGALTSVLMEADKFSEVDWDKALLVVVVALIGGVAGSGHKAIVNRNK